MNLPINSDNLELHSGKWPAIIILLIFSVCAITGGILFYRVQKKRTFTNEVNELNAVMTLKIDELTSWRSEHFRDMKILSGNSVIQKLVLDYLEGKGDKAPLENIFQQLTENYDYKSIYIVDTLKVVRFSTSESDVNTIETDSINSSESDLQFDRDNSGIFMDMAISITDPRGKYMGALVLRIDPQAVLFPLIQTWPGSGRSAETLLLRKEGDSIVFLNNLRHADSTALKFKLPLFDPHLPAAVAANGYTGYFEGIDYRGVPVLSYVGKVPDSPWYMVAKVDKSEVFSPLNEQVVLISIIATLLIATFTGITLLYFRNQRIKYLNEISNIRDKLYSIITHDLKTPFVSIMGYSELLYEKSMKDDHSRTREFTSIIYNSSTNAIELLNNLTSWTRLQTGRTLFNPTQSDLVQLINEGIGICRSYAGMKSIQLKLSAPPELLHTVDRIMFSTIMRNLIMNAVKFSYHNSEVMISAIKKNDFIELSVKDSGIGMDRQTIQKILSRDKYEPAAGTANEKGTGLGLFLCMEFITMHNGTLDIESEAGRGSRVIVRLPA